LALSPKPGDALLIIGGGGICVFNNSDAVLEHCLIEHNRLMTNCHGGGISVENSLVTVRNCLIRHNRTTNNYHGAGISLDDASATKVKIVNCTIVSNVCGGVGGGVVFFGTTAKSNVIVNSILYGNHKLDSATPDNVYDINKPAVSNALAYCCLTAKSGLGYNEQGNTIEDPAFVAFEGGDYRLQRGSPCVNTGSNQWDWMAGATDLGGRPRVLDGAVDMGAFEWSPGGTLLTIR